jgi:thioredoxin reductase (NADPH)
MSTWPVPSALDANTQAFPHLTQRHIDRLIPAGKIRAVTSGEVLFEPGDAPVPFFVVLSGSMEIVQPVESGERAIASHRAGQFTGEINMISGQRSLVRGRVTGAGEFLEITPEGLRSIVSTDPELSEIFMRAFILRRVALVHAGYGNIVLLGSRHSADTLRLREFLSRNGHPTPTWISTAINPHRRCSTSSTSRSRRFLS